MLVAISFASAAVDLRSGVGGALCFTLGSYFGFLGRFLIQGITTLLFFDVSVVIYYLSTNGDNINPKLSILKS